MFRAAKTIALTLVLLVNTEFCTALATQADHVTSTSPSGSVVLEVSVRPIRGSFQLTYSIRFHNKPVILDSSVSIELSDGITLGKQSKILSIKERKVDDRFRHFPGKRLIVDDHYSEVVLDLLEQNSTKRRWQLVARVYDDGVAFRYRFPLQAGWSELHLEKEKTRFTLPSNAKTCFLPLSGFLTSHEGLYVNSSIEALPADQFLDVPFLAEIPDSGWIAITEANLTNYAGMLLKRDQAKDSLSTQLATGVNEDDLTVNTPLPAESPWRVIMIGKNVADLVESDILLKLNAPSKIAETSWIRPGKTTFPWWNGFYEEGLSFKPGLNTAFAKHYIDFCAEYNIPYHSLDGIGNTAWYGGPIVPYDGDDPTTPIDGLDIQEVVAYAKQKGVRLRLWLHWQAAQAHMRRAFPLYKKWGIEGVMIDFMDRSDQQMVQFQHELLQLAADNQLTVNFHGAAPPTGLERTFPNLLNTEAVMNLEYNKWNQEGIPPDHDTTVPFTRMLAGPLDYHQGSFRTVSKDDFKPQDVAPVVIGTPCRMLASYVVFQNHLPMLADYPTAYRQSDLTQVAAKIPATWDDTVVLTGELGEVVAIARRAKDNWWIGVMTNSQARKLELALDCLGQGNFLAHIYQDSATAPQQFNRTEMSVTSDDTLAVALTKAGGALVHLTPMLTTPPGWKLVWSDDFERLDPAKWIFDEKLPIDERLETVSETRFVSINNGHLSLGCDKTDIKRVGRAVSTLAQHYGRWEVRAKLPASSDIQSTIYLFPNVPWPSGGEIDIMSNTGESYVTNSEFHWGSSHPFFHGSRVIPQRSVTGGMLENFSDDFHTYAVEWTPNQLRYYVDDVHHTTYYSDEVGDFLPKLVLPMRLAMEARTVKAGKSGGQSPKLLIDWVRIFEPNEDSGQHQLANGGFEKSVGSLAGWHVFGNQMTGEPNVLPAWQHSRHGQWSLSLCGPTSGEESYSGVSQGIRIKPGQRVVAKAWVKVDSRHSLMNTANRATLKVEFYDRVGEYFGGPNMLDFKEIVIADNQTAPDSWQQHELKLESPAGTVEARLSLVFAQKEASGGRVYIDDVELAAQDN